MLVESGGWEHRRQTRYQHEAMETLACGMMLTMGRLKSARSYVGSSDVDGRGRRVDARLAVLESADAQYFRRVMVKISSNIAMRTVQDNTDTTVYV